MSRRRAFALVVCGGLPLRFFCFCAKAIIGIKIGGFGRKLANFES